MSKYLISVVETYRADTEAEAAAIINEAKEDNRYVLSKYASTKRETKQKGEVIDEWMRVSLTKIFDVEKEPSGCTTIEYDTEGSAF